MVEQNEPLGVLSINLAEFSLVVDCPNWFHFYGRVRPWRKRGAIGAPSSVGRLGITVKIVAMPSAAREGKRDIELAGHSRRWRHRNQARGEVRPVRA